MARVRAKGQSFEQLQGVSADWEPYPADGLTVRDETLKGSPDPAAHPQAAGWLSLRGLPPELSFRYGPDAIAILKSRDPYDYLAVVHTDGINYDLTHETVLARYREWEQRYGLELTGAGQDWLEATFTQPPNDWFAFAQEVYECCPDVVDQGTGDVAALARAMHGANTLYLCWD